MDNKVKPDGRFFHHCVLVKFCVLFDLICFSLQTLLHIQFLGHFRSNASNFIICIRLFLLMSKPSQDNFVTLSPNHLTRVVPLISIRPSWEGWSSYKLTWGERRVTSWTGCQTIAKVSLNCKLAVYIIDWWVNFHKYTIRWTWNYSLWI